MCFIAFAKGNRTIKVKGIPKLYIGTGKSFLISSNLDSNGKVKGNS